jgi:hypothetical protein
MRIQITNLLNKKNKGNQRKTIERICGQDGVDAGRSNYLVFSGIFCFQVACRVCVASQDSPLQVNQVKPKVLI